MDKKGFTLIEVLTVVVIVGILASLQISRLDEARDRAFIAAMKADLNHVRLAQVIYYQNNGDTYADDVDDLTSAELFRPTGAVATVIEGGDDSTWSATTTHPSTPVTCAFDAAFGSINCSNEQNDPEREVDLPGTNVITF